MNRDKTEYFKRQLLKEKENAINTLEMMEKHHPTDESIKEYTQELSSYDNHPADHGTEVFMAAMEFNLKNHQQDKIAQIDTALASTKDGTYGSCQICGADIPEERLKLIPQADLCIKCAENRSNENELKAGRPVEEDILSPYYGTSNEDYHNYTGFDGEDAYQAVARFNDIKNDPSFATGDHLGVFDNYNIGSVEEVENISEAYYKSQLPYTGDGVLEEEKKRKK